MEYLDRILTPDTLGFGAAVAALLLAKSKYFTERDYQRARELLDMGYKACEVASQTRLQVEEIKNDIIGGNVQGDSTTKRMQRKARAIIRGWLR